jgi:glycosyltransferase involved in cell wall biosynthesis
MKVVVIHNAYQSAAPSGEDVVARAEAELLRAHGHAVVEHWRRNDELEGIGKIELALAVGLGSICSVPSFLEIRSLLRRERPDVAHFHNTFPLISPSAYLACRLEGVPVVQTLHNFRPFCANGLLFRDGRVCELCPEQGRFWGVIHGCYRGSRLMSAAPVLGQYLHGVAGSSRRLIDRFIALTGFARNKLIRFGLPAERISVKPNFAPRLAAEPHTPRRGFLFAGRVDEAKGARLFAEAARLSPDLDFVVVGDGPLAPELTADRPGNLCVRGRLPAAAAQREIAAAAALVVPSLCYEGFPRVIAEAMSAGVPVIASGHGSLAAIVAHEADGLLFSPGDPSALAQACARIAADAALAAELAAGARRSYERKWTPESNARQLLDTYSAVVRDHAGGPP